MDNERPARRTTGHHHPGLWADLESNTFMMQVPTMWIYSYDDVEECPRG